MNTDHPRAPPLSGPPTPGTFKLSRITFNSLVFDMRPGRITTRAGYNVVD